jgi:hypothetical protein
MADKPTLDEIRARLANHTSVLWHNHAPADIAVLLEMVKGLEQDIALRDSRIDLAVRSLDYREFFGRYKITDMDAAIYLDCVIERLRGGRG